MDGTPQRAPFFFLFSAPPRAKAMASMHSQPFFCGAHFFFLVHCLKGPPLCGPIFVEAISLNSYIVEVLGPCLSKFLELFFLLP